MEPHEHRRRRRAYERWYASLSPEDRQSENDRLARLSREDTIGIIVFVTVAVLFFAGFALWLFYGDHLDGGLR